MDSLMMVSIMLYLLNLLGKYIAELKATYFTTEESPQSKNRNLQEVQLKVYIAPTQISSLCGDTRPNNLTPWQFHTKNFLLNKSFINTSFINKRYRALPRGHPYESL